MGGIFGNMFDFNSDGKLDSFVYEYVNCGGVKDNLKIEINYMLRCNVFEENTNTRKCLENWLKYGISRQIKEGKEMGIIENQNYKTLCLIKLTKQNNWFNILNIRGKNMSKKTVVVMPDTQKILENMGEQIKLARLRRNLSTELVAERAGISRATLWAVEKGTPTVAIGTYAAVLHALGGMDKDLELVAQDDEFGRRIQDMNLVTPKRAKRK